eukprot:jgi/Tetstr1/423972/TSEL_014583.t1
MPYALALKVGALSTRLDEHDNNKHKEQRDIPSDDDEVGKGGKEPEHGARTAAATDRVDALALLDAAHRTLEAVSDADEARLTYLRRFKAKKALTPEEQVAERLPYSRVFDIAEHERSTNVVDGLLTALEDKRLEWRFIIDRRVLNTFCARKRLRMETIMGVRHVTANEDYMFSFDLLSGFYAMGIAPSDSDYFTVNIRGTLYWLGRWRGARILPYVDDFLMLASSEPEALKLRHRVAELLDSLGMQHNPAKGLWEPDRYGQRLGVDIDTATGYFHAPADKLQRLARQAKHLLHRAAREARWLRSCNRSLGGLHICTWQSRPRAFYLRELHNLVGSKWGGRVSMTHQLRHDLQWWTAVPTQSNGRPIHRPLETAYMHCDNSGYGWGVFHSILPHLAGRRVLLHEDDQAVCNVLAGITSRSPEMMAELRKLWHRLDSNGVHIRARYIRSAANVLADRLSRHLDSDDWQSGPVLFAELEAMWGAHSVDGFASAMNAMLPRYNAAKLDPGCEAVDSRHLSDAEWRRENSYCNPPWPLLPDLVQKLRQSGAAAAVVAPRWEGKVWHHALTEMAVTERVVLPRRDLFRPGRRAGCDMPGALRWAGVPPLGDTAATVARYIAWQDLRGTVKEASLQPNLSAINGFYRDLGAEPVAQGGLINKKIKHFGGWAQLSSIVLDYINPTAVPCAASWQLFGWLTPWANMELPIVEQLAEAIAATINQRINTPWALLLALWLTDTVMADGIEMQQYHTEPNLMRVGDGNLCAISLGKEDEEFTDTLRLA